MSRMQRLSATNPLRLVINHGTRVATPSPIHPPLPSPSPSVPRSTPTPQIAVYGKGFVKASKDTWELFEKQKMECLVDSDITTAVCFLSGVCSGSVCVIMVAAWTATVHQGFTATVSPLLLRRLLNDKDSHGPASCMRELLLRLLRRKSGPQVV